MGPVCVNVPLGGVGAAVGVCTDLVLGLKPRVRLALLLGEALGEVPLHPTKARTTTNPAKRRRIDDPELLRTVNLEWSSMLRPVA
jgi:hypothetical protein